MNIAACPFCRCSDPVLMVVKGRPGYRVRCPGCNAMGPEGRGDKAVAAWNEAGAAPAEVEKLRRVLRRLLATA